MVEPVKMESTHSPATALMDSLERDVKQMLMIVKASSVKIMAPVLMESTTTPVYAHASSMEGVVR